jgi:hypothetical protein
MIIDMEMLGILGYSGYLAIIAGIAYDKFKSKSADGVQIADITSSVIEAQKIFNDFLCIIETVIDDVEVNDSDTVALIKEAVKITRGK